MVNTIWLIFLLTGVLAALWTGQPSLVTEAVAVGGNQAVQTALGLIGTMAFWLGIMRIAEDAGLVTLLAKLIRPLFGWLFPEIPRNHPAMGSIMLNLSANLLGLGNAATPMGLKAMEHLQELNSHPDTATNGMCTLLALNTSSVTLLPTMVIGVRMAAGSQEPMEIVGTTIIATCCSTVAALLADFFFRQRKRS